MGNGMAPVMFPGVHHYISRMGLGIGPPPMPSIHNPLHLQNQPMMCQTPVLNPVNYQDQMHGSNFYEQYARYMRFHHMQTASQVISPNSNPLILCWACIGFTFVSKTEL